MMDRIKGLTVALDQDYREDDAQGIINAIKLIKGVANVAPIQSHGEDFINRQQIKTEIAGEIQRIMNKLFGPL